MSEQVLTDAAEKNDVTAGVSDETLSNKDEVSE
jgi:hypothetical protein